MTVYLETTAALRDVLDGGGAEQIRRSLRDAELVITSRLTLAEVARVLARLQRQDPIRSAAIAPREASFLRDVDLWAVYPVDEAIWTRSGRAFPVEPVRTLDAIHLATIEAIAGPFSPLTVLSTDERIRQNAGVMRIG